MQATAQSALLKESLLEPEIITQPNEYYRAMRMGDPVHYDPKAGVYYVTRYEDLRTVTRDPITFSMERAWNKTFATGHFEEFKATLIREGGGYFPDAIMTDPPHHTRVRSLLQAAFTPRRIKLLEPAIKRVTGELVDKIAANGKADGVTDFAVPMTIAIMCEQMGLEHVDGEKVATWAHSFGAVRGNQSREQMLKDTKHFCDLQHYIIARVRERQENRREDMISDLIYAREEGSANSTLTFEEVVSLTRALVIGGVETISTAISNLLFLVATNPAIAAKLDESYLDDSRLSRFTEETMRIEPPARGLFRMTTKEVVLGGKNLPENSMLCLLFASGNDDDSVFDHPREFDMDRKNLARNLSFGAETHMCVGIHLARMEVRIAAQEIARRLTNIKLAIPRADIKYIPTLAMLSIENLPLTFTRRN
jgi:cytochrome P450